MAMATGVYGNFLLRQNNGNAIDLDSATIKIALVNNSYTPNFDSHDFFDDVTNEVSGTGYTAGGATLASQTLTLDTANNRLSFDGANTEWAAATLTGVRGCVVYQSTGTAGTSVLIAAMTFGADYAVTAATLSLTWHANGLVTISY